MFILCCMSSPCGCSCLVRRLCPPLHHFYCVRMCVLIFLPHVFFPFLLTIILTVGMVDVFPDIRLVSWPFSWREKLCRFHTPHTYTQSETRTKNCSIKLAASVMLLVVWLVIFYHCRVVSLRSWDWDFGDRVCSSFFFLFFSFFFFLVEFCESLLEFLRRANFPSSVCRWDQKECRLARGACLSPTDILSASEVSKENNLTHCNSLI